MAAGSNRHAPIAERILEHLLFPHVTACDTAGFLGADVELGVENGVSLTEIL